MSPAPSKADASEAFHDGPGAWVTRPIRGRASLTATGPPGRKRERRSAGDRAAHPKERKRKHSDATRDSGTRRLRQARRP
jgi:hypothetical protein